MQTIQDKAIQTYNKNIAYLSKEYPNVVEKLALLDVLIEDGKYTNKYDLEYLDGYFDVKELKSGHYLYGENSIGISKELNKQVNYKKKSHIFEGFPLYYQYEKFKDMTDKTSALSAIYPLMTYYLDNTTDTQEMKLIEK
ncbi:hypothetical protein JHD49_10620, partial [Sulfurimonas sp. SAG-AH-194-C21]|nr:hypothetical protein [Sulfurimonas sp. SAG-AH-194-C21]